MLEIYCSGSPYEIGYQHGTRAREKVVGSITFYKWLFETTCDMKWSAAQTEAAGYLERLETCHPRLVQEMRGVAVGASVPLLDVVALNVRTEIAFGLFTYQEKDVLIDGCTALGYKLPVGQGDSLLSQNWDWQVEQSPNIFVCHIDQSSLGLPSITMITEGGIIGKIGFNSRGVGLCQNAIRARGVDPTQLPVHLAMRTILESSSRNDAIAVLESTGVAGSVHLLVADPSGSTGLECTSVGIRQIQMDALGKVVHANHLLLEHPNVDEPPWLEDSAPRVCRLTHLVDSHLARNPSLDGGSIFEMLKDEEGFPASINRRQISGCETQTLFTIIMNLSRCEGVVTFGRPTEITEQMVLSATE